MKQNTYTSRKFVTVFAAAALIACGASGADAFTDLLKGLVKEVVKESVKDAVVGAVKDDAKEPAKEAVKESALSAPKADVKGTVAVVNGVAIDAVELRRARKVMLRGQNVPAGQEAAVNKAAVEQLISAELLYQDAAKQDIKDLDKQVDTKMVQGKARFKDEKDFINAVKDLEMSEKDLREYTRREILISRFVETNFLPKVTVTDADVKAFYDGNQDKFTKGASVKASHILIGVDAKASTEDKKQAREKAEKLKKELNNNAEFATLAKANSTCPSSQQGGDLGYFGKGQMVPEFEKAVFALKPGEISDVVETQFGYHIIKLTDKKAGESVALNDVKSKIEDFLKGQKVGELIQKHLSEARKKAKIELILK